MPRPGPRQNRAYYVKLWQTHGVIACTRGDQLGKGKTELFLDEEKKVKIIGKTGEWFVNPARAVRAAELKRDSLVRALKKRIVKLNGLKIEIRSWE